MQIKKVGLRGSALHHGQPVGHWIAYCGVQRGHPDGDHGILTEVDSCERSTFLPMSDDAGSHNRYLGRLNQGKMKIRVIMARKGDAPEYINKMQLEVFKVLAEARRISSG